MRRILHILSTQDSALVQTVVAAQQGMADTLVEIVDLAQPEPDYPALIERIFAADSIEVW